MEEDPKSGGQKKNSYKKLFCFFVYFFSLLVMYATSVICLLHIFIEVVLLYTTHMNAIGCGIDLKTDLPKLLTKNMKNIFSVCLATHKRLALKSVNL